MIYEHRSRIYDLRRILNFENLKSLINIRYLKRSNDLRTPIKDLRFKTDFELRKSKIINQYSVFKKVK